MLSSQPLPPELERLNRIYVETCEAFDRGEITDTDARSKILGLSAIDKYGKNWIIDTKNSTRRRPSFKEGETTPQLNDEFARMNRVYQETCAQFNRGLISATQARMKILGLSFTDETERTWRVDTTKSGNRASFTCERQHNTRPNSTVEQRTDDIAAQKSKSDAIQAQDDAEYEKIVSRRDFLSNFSDKSVLFGLLSVALIYQGTKLLTGSGDSTVTTEEPKTETDEDEGDVLVNDAAGDNDWFDKPSDVPLNTDIEFGRSVDGVPLNFYRRQVGKNGARVLVVGCIHGDEAVGTRIIDILRDMPLEGNLDLWTVRTINPDGQQRGIRQNARGVDLNRNFPINWQKIGNPDDWQYSGPAPASEPEVRAIIKLGKLVKPDFLIWYHQDYFRIGPGTGHEGRVRAMYAEMVGLPLVKLDCLCGYTGDKPLLESVFGGTGANWAQSIQGSKDVSMTVEFGPELSEEDAQRNAKAVVDVTNANAFY